MKTVEDKITSKLPNPSMNSEVLIALAKRFRKIEADQKDLDFRKAEWARDARAQFPDDERFILWCKSDLGETHSAALSLCLSVRAVAVARDARTWEKIGGRRSILAVEKMPKREQIRTLQAAVARGVSVRAIVNEHTRSSAPPVPYKPRVIPAGTPLAEWVSDCKRGKMSDVEMLARFIADHLDVLPKLPPKVEVIVRMYVPNAKRKVTL